jgi:RNA polymerase sigma-70 factor, ECF subfamily
VIADGEASLLAAARAGDRDAFGRLVESQRHSLLLHCYRFLGSLEDAEDLVQETLLRAWRRLDRFEGRSSFRHWLYRIATHACLDARDSRSRRMLPHDLGTAPNPAGPPGAPPADIAWLQPYPDSLLELAVDPEPGPEARYDPPPPRRSSRRTGRRSSPCTTSCSRLPRRRSWPSTVP